MVSTHHPKSKPQMLTPTNLAVSFWIDTPCALVKVADSDRSAPLDQTVFSFVVLSSPYS